MWLVPNAVDVAHFRSPRPRPGDLPSGPVALYAGTAHDARIDVDLVAELAGPFRQVTSYSSARMRFRESSQQLLDRIRTSSSLGPDRIWSSRPTSTRGRAIVPHLVTPFMESLDPIKAYECLAIHTPTVATPLPGFREHAELLNVAPREEFAERVAAVLDGNSLSSNGAEPPSWDERAETFEAALRTALDSEPRPDR